jgi:hypothetical protein
MPPGFTQNVAAPAGWEFAASIAMPPVISSTADQQPVYISDPPLSAVFLGRDEQTPDRNISVWPLTVERAVVGSNSSGETQRGKGERYN